MSDIEYSVITSDVIKNFDCIFNQKGDNLQQDQLQAQILNQNLCKLTIYINFLSMRRANFVLILLEKVLLG